MILALLVSLPIGWLAWFVAGRVFEAAQSKAGAYFAGLAAGIVVTIGCAVLAGNVIGSETLARAIIKFGVGGSVIGPTILLFAWRTAADQTAQTRGSMPTNRHKHPSHND
jgi:hypothetical protein